MVVKCIVCILAVGPASKLQYVWELVALLLELLLFVLVCFASCMSTNMDFFTCTQYGINGVF